MKLILCLHKYGVPLDDPCPYPLGFMYVSAVLKQAGHDVTVLNYNLYDYDFLHEIKGADAVLFTGFEEFDALNSAFALMCQEQGIKTILGGALATFDTDNQAHCFDMIITGEAESVIEQALHSTGIIHGTKPVLSTLPYPDYEGFGIREYHRRNGIKHIGILTSRGCPFNCSFCAHTCRFQMRSIRDVEQEIDYYRQQYQPDMIIFNDNTLNLNTERFLQICRMMEPKGLEWTAAIRVDQFNEECAAAAKRSGCRYFVVGVESFRQEKLDRMNKRITVEQIHQTLDLLHSHDIDYHGNIILGLDDETETDIQQQINSVDWQKYKLFPVMIQPFIGIAAGRSKLISSKVISEMIDSFQQYIKSKGKYTYPDLFMKGI